MAAPTLEPKEGCATPTIFLIALGCVAFIALLVLALVNGFGGQLLGGLPMRPPPAGVEVGPGGGVRPAPAPGADANGVPPVSERYFSGGTIHAAVTGDFALTTDLSVDRIQSYVANDGLAWIAFGDEMGSGTAQPEVLITFKEPEDTVMVAQGATFAKGVDDQCSFEVQVSSTEVSGHIMCPNATVYTSDGTEVGRSAIDVTFDATS